MKGSAASLTCIGMYSEEVKEVSEAAHGNKPRYLIPRKMKLTRNLKTNPRVKLLNK